MTSGDMLFMGDFLAGELKGQWHAVHLSPNGTSELFCFL